jgi:hypothetical protein
LHLSSIPRERWSRSPIRRPLNKRRRWYT